MLGTRCHMLGMYVVLENYQGMLCDYPNAYEDEPGFEFLKTVPTIWDETKVLGNEVSQYITIARRSKEDWFIGSVTNSMPRDVKIPLSFLPEGEYEAEIFRDAEDTDVNPNNLVKESREVNRGDILAFDLAAGGGAVVHLRKKKE